jgi:LysM repeat protein
LNTTATNGIPTAISASPQNDDLVWLGTAFGAIYLFDFNGAVSVSQVDKPPLPRRYITKIEASPHDENTVYVSYSGYDANTPDTPGKVLKSTDKGQTWVNISGNLTEANNLDVPVSTLAIDPANENRIWIGTDVGVYITEDGGQTWSSWRNNMPVVAIMDLKYNATTNFLMASTHGRGIWRVSGTSPSIPTHLLITPPNLQISQQGNGVIKIEVENISNLCSVDIQLRFNSSIIQASVDDVKIEPPFVASVGPISGTGFIEFKATSTTPINSDSVVASVTWHGVQLGHTGLVIEAVSPSALNLFDCNDNSINHKTGNGMIEVVPTTACDNPSTPPGATIGFCHQVQPTDTLYGLGRQYGVDPFLISRLNQLYSPNLIYDDQSLFIPEKYDGGAGPNVYIVKPGETLAGVADQCRLPVSTLAQANQLDPEATLQECQALIIPVRPYPPPFIGHPRPICPLPGRYWPPCRFCSW